MSANREVIEALVTRAFQYELAIQNVDPSLINEIGPRVFKQLKPCNYTDYSDKELANFNFDFAESCEYEFDLSSHHQDWIKTRPICENLDEYEIPVEYHHRHDPEIKGIFKVPATWFYDNDELEKSENQVKIQDLIEKAEDGNLSVEDQKELANISSILVNQYKDTKDILKQVVDHLPTKRDWLDPDVEKVAKQIIS